MPTKILMPQLGESVVEGTISKWLKAEGDTVNEFEPLIEVTTDKVDTEIASPGSGTLLKVYVAEGTTVKAGTLLAYLGQPGEALPDGTPETAPTTAPPAAGAAAPASQDLGFISPVVSKIAAEQGVNLAQVKGTGAGGRITKKDALAFVEARAAGAAEPAPAEPLRPKPPAASPAEVVAGASIPLTNIRRAIAEHMVRSKRTSPHVTTVMEVDLSRVVAHREAHKAQFTRDGVKLTFTPYFVVASVAALKAFPIVNSSWGEDRILLKKEVHIGVAAATEEGLIVPVIKNADQKSLLKIAAELNDLAERARHKQLKPDDVAGGTFTITNHGVSGSLFATPIISQPQCAILGVGLVEKRVKVIDDAIAIRPMVYLSLTFDHRIIDGAIGDYFLAKVKEALEKWG